MTERRAQIIRQLLTHYNTAEDPTTSTTGIPGTGERTPLMNPEWTHSYRELERCLRLMRNEAPWLWWDIRERYLAANTRRITVPVTRTQKGPRPQLPANTEEIAPIQLDTRTGTYLVRTWNPNVNPNKVEAGIGWLALTFQGEPFLPRELTEQAA